VHPEHGLAHRAKGIGEVELGLHDPLEEVGGLAEDHSFDIGESHMRIFKCTEDGLTHEATKGYVEASGLVVGLAHTDDGARGSAHYGPSNMQMRFCCKHGPDVA
jgi:hypothetical protein